MKSYLAAVQTLGHLQLFLVQLQICIYLCIICITTNKHVTADSAPIIDLVICLMNTICYSMRRHARDVYLRMTSNNNGYSYVNVLVHFGETRQVAAAKDN